MDNILAGAYDEVMHPEEERFRGWEREGKIEPTRYIAEAIVRAAGGLINRHSPKVERGSAMRCLLAACISQTSTMIYWSTWP